MIRNFFFTLFLFALFLHSPVVSLGQWQRTPGPEGGVVSAIVSDGTILYTAIGESATSGLVVSGDVYRSSDLGVTWIPIGSAIPGNNPVYSLGINSKAIYCGTRSGLFRMMKTNLTWDSIGPMPNGYRVDALIATDSDIIASVRFAGLFRSTNDGETWTKLDLGPLRTAVVNALDRRGSNLFVASQGQGVYFSPDNGVTWETINDNISGDDLYVNALYHLNGIEFAGTLRGAFFTTDFGNHWDSCRTGLPSEFGPAAFASEGIKTFTLYANMQSMGIYFSTDSGASWRSMNTGLQQFVSASSLAVTSGMIFTGIGGSGVVRARTDTKVWENASYGISNTSVFGLRQINASGNVMFAGTLDNDFGLAWRSSDKGMTWAPLDSLSNLGVIDFETKDGIIFAGISGGGVYISSDDGIKWKAASIQIPGASYINSITATPNAVVAGILGNVGVIRTTDLGNTWTTPLSDASANINRVFYDSVSHTLFAGSNFGMFTSQDDGATWMRPKTAIDSSTIFSFARIGNFLLAGTWFGLYRSSDNGLTWTPAEASVANLKFSAIQVEQNAVYAAVHGNVLISNDSGLHWQSFENGIPKDIDFGALSSDGANLYAGSIGYGVWKASLVSSNSVKNVFATDIDLQTTYSRTTPILRYTVPTSTYVKLDLINVSGTEILRLCNEVQSAGTHEYLLTDAICSKIASGMYFANLTASELLRSSKVLILR